MAPMNATERVAVLQVMGINVQPLLAVGGVSGIAIGFGAQSVSANAITGINLVSLAITASLDDYVVCYSILALL